MKLVSLLSVLLTSLVPCMGASGQATKPAARSVKTSKPNVIFILVDDMGWGDLDSNWSQQKLNGRTLRFALRRAPPCCWGCTRGIPAW